MAQVKEFYTETHKRKLSIVRYLSTLFLGGGILTNLIYLYFFLTGTLNLSPTNTITWLVIVLFTICIFYIRYRLIYRQLIISFVIISSIVVFLSLLGFLTYGTSLGISYVLLIAIIFSAAIVIDIKTAFKILFVISVIIALLSILQTNGTLSYIPTDLDSDLTSALIYIFFFWVIINVSRIGYSQMEHYYSQALNHAQELEELNKNLDKIVKKRTEQLKFSFERQAESVHNQAIMGSITQPLLHDLATPISSLNGVFNLIKRDKADTDQELLYETGEVALKQMTNLLEEARKLMSGKKIKTLFFPKSSIVRLMTILKYELNKNNIEVKIDIRDTEKGLRGYQSLFERIITNILLNAIEELTSKNGDRKILIKGSYEDSEFVLKIKDNGSGIPKENFEKIFEPDYTSKHNSQNLGFGLPFVKKTISQEFNGSIEVNSELGNYTEFTLRFGLND